jgi:RNA polymerase sigma factor (TIGR02999 family)
MLAKDRQSESFSNEIDPAYLPVLVRELRAAAAARLRGERRDQILQTTVLVNEAYLRLAEIAPELLRSPSDLGRVAACVIRRILTDHARARSRQKRGGSRRRVDLDSGVLAIDPPSIDLLALDEALERLAKLAPQQARIVELRFFGGLAASDVARAMNLSTSAVEREWRGARAWLRRELALGAERKAI